MIISPPFLPDRLADQSEDAWLSAAMPESPQDPELPGTFPVGFHLDWHGGVHLLAPAGQRVRAVADGTVVFVRNPKPSNTDPKDPLNYSRAGQGPSWTDDGCVVVRHEAEIGSDGSRETSFSFYSVYMHLGQVDCDKKMKTVPPPKGSKKGTKPTKKQTQVPAPFPISRKELIGVAGSIYGKPGRIHFEIVCDDAALQAILGRAASAPFPMASDGRKDSVFGEVFFRVPPGQPVRQDSPVDVDAAEISAQRKVLAAKADLTAAKTDLANAIAQANQRAMLLGATTKEQFVGLRYSGGDCTLKPAGGGSPATTVRGYLATTTYSPDGTSVGAAPLLDEDAEYELMAESRKIIDFLEFRNSQSPPGTTASALPSQSAVFELLRFGRVLGPDTLDPPETPHWRKANLEFVPSTPPGANPVVQGVWIDLNAIRPSPIPGAPAVGAIQKYGEGDFPPWSGWKVVDDSADQDSRCNAQAVVDILDTSNPPDGKVTPDEARTQLARPEIRAKLARLLCKFPTEWDASSIDARWAWLKTKSPENPNPLDTDDKYSAYADHVRALCIRRNTAAAGAPESWEEFTAILADASGAPFPIAHWHLHPFEFIRTFRKCGWLAQTELANLYPRTSQSIVNKYYLATSQILRRYGIIHPFRASHFFGQGSVESSDLRVMMERSDSSASHQSEVNGYYSDPTDLYGYFHSYEKVGNSLGNVQRSELKDSRGNSLPVVLGKDSIGRPSVNSPAQAQVDARNSHVGDGMKFRGRGFKQLTGLANYTSYWVFRGWLREKIDFDPNWWIATTPPKRVPNIQKPQLLSLVPFNCIDSGGQFAIKNGIPKVADIGIGQPDSDAVSRIVNRFDSQSFARRYKAMLSAYKVLGP